MSGATDPYPGEWEITSNEYSTLTRSCCRAPVEKPSQGEILAAGPGKVNESGDVRPLDVKVGDKIIFGQYAGSTVKIDGEELLILSESEIFGVVEG